MTTQNNKPIVSFINELKRRNVVKVAALYLVASWVVLQVADVLFPNLGAPDWAFGLVVGLLAVLFLPVLMFSWIYEVTPEGIKREKDIDRSESVTAETGRRINVLIVVLLVIAIGAVIVDRLVPETPYATRAGPEATDSAAEEVTDGPPALSIAVLPFADMSPQQDQEYFTDGISEELLNLLARVPDFRVAGRTSSFAFKGRNEDLRLIGDKLGVSSILEGSVRKDGDQIRVTAQLIKTDDGYHLWSETYDRKLENVFALQDDIAGEVVAALKATLLEADDTDVPPMPIQRARPTDNGEAYASFLRGRHHLSLFTYKGMARAVEEFQEAVRLDPDFAQAYAGLAETYLTMADFGFRSDSEIEPLATSAVESAMALNPDLSEVLTAKAMVLLYNPNSRDQQRELLERAVEINPNDATALVELARRVGQGGNISEALPYLRRAYEVDPLSPLVLSTTALIYKATGGDAQADRFMTELAAVVPGSSYLYRKRAQLAELDDDFLGSATWLHRAVEADPEVLMPRLSLAADLLTIGALGAARKYADQAYALNPDSPRAMARLVDIMQYQGEKEAALAMLERELARFPTDLFLLSYRATVLFHMERFDTAREQIVEITSPLMQDPPEFRRPVDFFWAPRLIWIMKRDGDTGQADAIHGAFEQIMEDSGEDAWWFIGLGGRPLVMSRWAAGVGDRDELLAELEKLSSTSHGSWTLFQDPMFQAFADDPGYAAVAERFEGTRERHRQALVEAGVL
jgi:TolB-like protein/Tfp pilus assembly protein PilF